MTIQTKAPRLDMLHGPIWSRIPLFALPVAATAILGQLFNAADIVIVGNFTGDLSTAAVAAVGVYYIKTNKKNQLNFFYKNIYKYIRI